MTNIFDLLLESEFLSKRAQKMPELAARDIFVHKINKLSDLLLGLLRKTPRLREWMILRRLKREKRDVWVRKRHRQDLP